MTDAPIHGWNDPRFDAVRQAFESNFSDRNEVGAAVSVYLNGEPVVDLWGGWYAPDREREWDRNTLVNVYSSTKGLTAFCAHRLVEQGKLDIDAPVAEYWPEFAAAGKQDIPVRWLLCHKAGMAAVKRELVTEDMFNWETMTSALAEQAPWWTPGEKHGYHAMTFGWLVGEVVRRIDGRSLGTCFREEFAAPLGLDAHIGTGPELDARISTVIEPQIAAEFPPTSDLFGDPDSVGIVAVINPPVFNPGGPAMASRRDWRAAEIPAANGHATARALARIYGAAANGGQIDGVHVLNPETIEQGIEEQTNGPDAVLMMPIRFGLGYAFPSELMPMSPNDDAMFWGGAGGSTIVVDESARVCLSYVMNQMKAAIVGDRRGGGLGKAFYACLG
jgi:CubicO group peptidase (beta-lactamase class C family)